MNNPVSRDTPSVASHSKEPGLIKRNRFSFKGTSAPWRNAASSSGAGNRQNEPGLSCCIRKQGNHQRLPKTSGIILKELRSQLEVAPTARGKRSLEHQKV